MVIDTSALLAILFDEPEQVAFARAIRASEVRLISAMSMLEASIGAAESTLTANAMAVNGR